MVEKKRNKVILVVFVLILLVIALSIKKGMEKGNITFCFQENQAVTFISALLLGLTGLTSLIIYRLKKKMYPEDKMKKFWLFSFFGFFYLCLDEYFMAHEGIDDAVASLFIKINQPLELDGLTIGFFGLVALIVCFFYRKELLKHKRESLSFFIIGFICLSGTAFFDLLHSLGNIGIVIEESFKIMGVSFFFAGYSTVMFSLISRITMNNSNRGEE